MSSRHIDPRVGLIVASFSMFIFAPEALAEPGIVRLRAAAHMTIMGAGLGDRAGEAVAGVGDFNGDGVPDIAVGAPQTRRRAVGATGAAYVIFGRRSGPSTVGLASLGTSGVRIDGGGSGDRLGASVAGIGDVNGDGLADVAVGAPGVDRGPKRDIGAVYVVFGSRAGGIRDVAALGKRGARIFGSQSYAGVGESLAAAGDVNHDGIPDVGLSWVEQQVERVPVARVIFGPMSAGDAFVDSPSLGGFSATPPTSPSASIGAPHASARVPVTGVGDVNRDGLDDVAFSDPSDNPANPGSQAIYVVYGQRSPGRVTADGDRGFALFSADPSGYGSIGFGVAVTGGIDLTGDGLPDVVGSKVAHSGATRSRLGAVYAVPGTPAGSRVNVQLASAALDVQEAEVGDLAGRSLGVLRSGRTATPSRLLIGASGRRAKSCRRTGAVFVVNAPLARRSTNLRDSGGVYEVVGDRPDAALGYAVADAGDLAGDGVHELLVGAPGRGDDFGGEARGYAYVVRLPRTGGLMRDTAAPRLCLRRPVLSAWQFAHGRELVLSVGVEEAATVDARVTLRAPDLSRITFGTRGATLAESGRADLVLDIPRGAQRAARYGAGVRLDVWARDQTGNVARRRIVGRLER
ncbi:MAG: hypothetical protein QOJ97_282 [Solirubrobacteraceae bacterium]|jgi:glycosylphosphatidylinositol phospholipase D|nr:hypothetical protein [Solirubrobacteraceae bacterium]